MLCTQNDHEICYFFMGDFVTFDTVFVAFPFLVSRLLDFTGEVFTLLFTVVFKFDVGVFLIFAAFCLPSDFSLVFTVLFSKIQI